MKKSYLFIPVLVIIIVVSCFGNALAAQPVGGDEPNASLYLDSYAVDLIAMGNGQMAVEMDVNATGYMSKIGVYSLYIEHKINGVWQEYDTVYGLFHSDFYDYNNYTYLGEYFFNGIAGRQYRVTMTAYASNSTGSDTGSVMSGAVTCRNP